jgi:GR25 family glycosyltransferase involved in LPS biosynthesis
MKAFIIRLENVKESRDTANDVMKHLDQFGFETNFFNGIDAKKGIHLFKKENRKIADLGIKTQRMTANEYKNIFPENELPKNAVDVTIRKSAKLDSRYHTFSYPGVVGCFYSHYRLWEMCVKLNEPIFIFEDDVIFLRKYYPVDWNDVIMVCTGKRAFEHDFYKPLLETPTGNPTAISIPGSQMPGAVGYGIKPHAAKTLVETYNTEMLPADTCLNRFVVELQCHSYLMGRAAIKDDGKISLTNLT